MSKVILVTGASRGIGAAICSYLLQPSQSCNVVAIARSTAPLQAVQQEHANHFQYVAGDITAQDTIAKAIDLAIRHWGRLDGMVINHGVVEPVAKIADANLEEWKSGFEVNVLSAVALIQAALPHIRKARGRIILTSSGASVKGTATWGSYCVSKASLNSIARTLATEEPDIITVAIRPGVVDTEMQDTLAREHFRKMEEKDADRFRTMRKEGKMLRPEQPGNLMARLVLNVDKELNGQFVDWNDAALDAFHKI